MLKKIVFWILCLFAIAVVSCSISSVKPGTGGTNSAEKIEITSHLQTPEDVRCYVCHKGDMPTAAFHKSFGTNCAQCHLQTTWIPFNYAHAHWPLGIHREVQSSRCHTQSQSYDFMVWQCFGCHHDQAQVVEAHKNRPNFDVHNCIACHKGAEKLPALEQALNN